MRGPAPSTVGGIRSANGAGKSTPMNLVAGLVRTSRGRVVVRGEEPADSEAFYRCIGYCTQYDPFPPGVTGRQKSPLRV